MEKIKIVYDRVNDYLKKYQSGIDTVDSFNGKIEEVQYALANELILILGTNGRAQEYLAPIIPEPLSITSSATGIFTQPPDFMHFLGASYMGKPVHELTANQLDAHEMVPQRRGDLTKKRVNITRNKTGWEAKPASSFDIKLRYIQHPPEAKIVFTMQSLEDEDILSYDATATVDLVWSKDCLNLITYMMLEKYGISERELILNEYAQLGLAKEAIK